MTRLRGDRDAFGAPGSEPRWAAGDKSGIGTAYSADSRLWFTLRRGIVTEVYSPTIDHPQMRDCQLLVSDEDGLFHEEQRDLEHRQERLADDALGYRLVNRDPEGRYAIHKEVIVHPHLPCLLQHVRLAGPDRTLLERLRLHLLCAPHLEMEGDGNTAMVLDVGGRELLAAEKDGCWLAIAASRPFAFCSCGYVGASDGWTDLDDNGRLDWEFDRAADGHVALTGTLPPAIDEAVTVALAIGTGQQHAITVALQALGRGFAGHRQRFVEQWRRPTRNSLPLARVATDCGTCYRTSVSLLLAHEDKTYPGALIASLAIPWGEVRSGPGVGGYHLVWCRDMVNTAMGLLAAGDRATPLRSLIYLTASQEADGGFPQNFWLDGRPHWSGIQLDEVAFPILLAWRLHRDQALHEFDPGGLVRLAAAYMIRHGPATEQERWEEASGYSPSTLASNIAALVCCACFLRERGDEATAAFVEDYADFLESNLERWTVTTRGSLVEDVARHYIRILPVAVDDIRPEEDPDTGTLQLVNQPPGIDPAMPARDVVDAGFLELVRYGIRRPDDSLIEDSLRVVDAVLRTELPVGPCWRRYNRDGYGQRDDGSPFEGWGRGRPWPLLTGERAHYELAAGRDVRSLIETFERLGSPHGLLPEQVWDGPDLPRAGLRTGGPTGSAMPLAWAHAEYLRLLRSAADGQVFDLVPSVRERYLGDARPRRDRHEIWKPNRRPRSVRRGQVLRFQAPEPFLLHWTDDDWAGTHDTRSTETSIGISYVDVAVGERRRAPVRAALYWIRRGAWEPGEERIVVVD